MITRRKFVTALCAGAIAPFSSFAQPSDKVRRIGFLSALSAPAMAAREEAFRRGLKEFGWLEGKNIAVEYRYADANPARLQALVAELSSLRLDAIVSTGPTTTSALKAAMPATPIVMGFDNDPVGAGLIASLAKPGGNITGLSGLSPELSGKQLQLLKEAIPALSQVTVLGSSTATGNLQAVNAVERVATALRIDTRFANIRNLEELKKAVQEARKARTGAFIVLASPAGTNYRTELVQLVLKSRVPAMYYSSEFVEEGGLMTYGVNIADMFRRSASYVDRILKGAKPGDLPVEQPTKFDFVINMRTAKALGLKIPATILLQVTKVID